MAMKEKIKKFFTYISAGVFQFSSDLFLLWFFTEIIGLYYLLSASVSVVVSSTIGFILNRKYVFKKSKRTFLKSYLIFLGISTWKIFAIIGLLFVSVEMFHLNYLIARVLVGILIVLGMYILHTKLTYKTDFE